MARGNKQRTVKQTSKININKQTRKLSICCFVVGSQLQRLSHRMSQLPSQDFVSRPYVPFQGPHKEGTHYAVVNHSSLYQSTFLNDTMDDALANRRVKDDTIPFDRTALKFDSDEEKSSANHSSKSSVQDDNTITTETQTHWVSVRSFDEIPTGQRPSLLWVDYEQIQWKLAFENCTADADAACLVDGYCNRNGLIRKAHLAKLINKFIRKRPQTCLKSHFPKTVVAEVDSRKDWFLFSISDVIDEIEAHESGVQNMLGENLHDQRRTKPSFFDRCKLYTTLFVPT